MNVSQRVGTANLAVGVNESVNAQNLSDLEKKHLPVIEAPNEIRPGVCFQVAVEIGKLKAHPNEHSHFIQFVALYADDTFLARTEFTSTRAHPKMTFTVSLEEPLHELRAYSHCNMHGTWLARKRVRLTVGPSESRARY